MYVLLVGAAALRRAMQIRALAQGRIAIDRFDQTFGDGLGIQAKEPGELPNSLAMRQPDDDRASIRWHSH